MRTAVERIINRFPPTIRVMDVGYGGLGGVNTTNYLRAHFGRIDGRCQSGDDVQRYMDTQPPGVCSDSVTVGRYPEDMPAFLKYDLLVLDPNIESNLKFWSTSGLLKAKEFLDVGGRLLTYIMLTDHYGTEETEAMLKEHRSEWWISEWDNIVRRHVVTMEREERRPEIMWVMLKCDAFEFV